MIYKHISDSRKVYIMLHEVAAIDYDGKNEFDVILSGGGTISLPAQKFHEFQAEWAAFLAKAMGEDDL